VAVQVRPASITWWMHCLTLVDAQRGTLIVRGKKATEFTLQDVGPLYKIQTVVLIRMMDEPKRDYISN